MVYSPKERLLVSNVGINRVEEDRVLLLVRELFRGVVRVIWSNCNTIIK
jgi:hypothetical protein